MKLCVKWEQQENQQSSKNHVLLTNDILGSFIQSRLSKKLLRMTKALNKYNYNSLMHPN